MCALAALACAVALAAGCGPSAVDDPTIRPGHERLLSEMLGADSTLPGDCHWDGGSIEKNIVVARYRCPDHLDHVLTLHHPSMQLDASALTVRFKLSASPRFPPALLDAVVARVRERENELVWDSPSGQDFGARSLLERGLARLGVDFHQGIAGSVIVVIAACALALAALFGARNNRPKSNPSPKAARSSRSPIAISTGILATVLAVVMAIRFRFQLDDFLYLQHARDCSGSLDNSLRVISTDLLFAAGELVNDWWPLFAVCNLFMLGIGATLWAYLVRRLGSPPDEALLAGALAALAPGTYMLLRFASGFQQLAINAILFGVLLLIDAAARVRDDAAAPWRRALLAAAFALGMLGTLVKYPVLVILPASTWIWARWLVPDAVRVLRRPWVHLGLGACLMIPLLIGLETNRSGELGKLGVAALGTNVAYLGRELLRGWLLGVAAAVFALALAGMGLGRLRAAGESRMQISTGTGVEAWLGPRRRLFGMLALSLLWITPFLLNSAYVTHYYLVLMVAPLAAIAARPLRRAAAGVRPAWLGAGDRAAAPDPVPSSHC